MSKNKLNPIYKKRNILIELKKQSDDFKLSNEERMNNINKRLDTLVDKVMLSRINKGQIKDDNDNIDKIRKVIYDEYKTEFYNLYNFLNESKNE